jgi:hypothetical protein
MDSLLPHCCTVAIPLGAPGFVAWLGVLVPFLPLWIALSEERVKLLRRHSFAAEYKPQGVHQEH